MDRSTPIAYFKIFGKFPKSLLRFFPRFGRVSFKHFISLVVILLASHVHAQFTGLPVTLSQPYDHEVLENNEPLLVWQTDLSTVIDNPRVSMRLTLVEIKQDQTPAEAMQINTPILLREELKSNTWSYSSTDTELLPGHHYAWQVIIFYNQVAVQQSEVWEFSIKEQLPPPISYYAVRQKADISVLTLTQPILYFSTDEKGPFQLEGIVSGDDGRQIPVTIKEMNGDKEVESSSETARNKNRYFKTDFSALNLEKGIYTFTWKLRANETRTLHFSLP